MGWLQVKDVKASDVGLGLVALAIALLLRMAITYACVLGGSLTLKERLFVVFAWLPKATVQVRPYCDDRLLCRCSSLSVAWIESN